MFQLQPEEKHECRRTDFDATHAKPIGWISSASRPTEICREAWRLGVEIHLSPSVKSDYREDDYHETHASLTNFRNKNKLHTAFHENPTNGFAAYNRSWTDGRGFHIKCSFLKLVHNTNKRTEGPLRVEFSRSYCKHAIITHGIFYTKAFLYN